MKTITTILISLFALSLYSQTEIESLPPAFPFDLRGDKLIVIDSNTVVVKNGQTFQFVTIHFDRRTKEYNVHGTNVMPKDSALIVLMDRLNLAQNRITQDSINRATLRGIRNGLNQQQGVRQN